MVNRVVILRRFMARLVRLCIGRRLRRIIRLLIRLKFGFLGILLLNRS